jgi:Mn2+/Fe2+ NRAMP family transporter
LSHTDVGMSDELPHEGDKESTDGTGAGIAIGGLNVVLYTILPALVVVGIWTLISVYAIVKWIGSAPQEPDPVVIVLGVVLLVSFLVVLFAVAVGLVGRSLNPKKRAKQ